jgi:hypothetical protein
MDEPLQPGPPIDEAELIEQIKLSILQAERGETVRGEDVLAHIRACYEEHFSKPALVAQRKASITAR